MSLLGSWGNITHEWVSLDALLDELGCFALAADQLRLQAQLSAGTMLLLPYTEAPR
jgi:hypothetical protein